MDLAEFLLARIAEDEAAARTCGAVYPSPWECSDRGWVAYVKADAPHFREVARLEQQHIAREDQPEWLGDALAHVARHDPARVLAECEAKRRIVEEVHHRAGDGPRGEWLSDWQKEACEGCGWGGPCDDYHVEHIDGCPTLRLLALPYADHPDYDPEWKG